MIMLMTNTMFYLISIVVSLIVLLGIYLMSKVEKARLGNFISSLISVIAVVITLIYFDIFNSKEALIITCYGIIIGSFIGTFLALKVKMIQMPELVALFNGLGGAASAIIGIVTLYTSPQVFEFTTSVLAIIVGFVTLIGSLVAAGKLAKIIDGKPVVYKFHQSINIFCILILIAGLVLSGFSLIPNQYLTIYVIIISLFSLIFGYLFSIRVGGADMPITISLLNSLSGVAGAIAGMAINNVLLVSIGGIVGASGLVLTQIMCKAMNRSLVAILLSKGIITSQVKIDTNNSNNYSKNEDYSQKIVEAKKVVIVPGYGMALSQAQFLVKQLYDELIKLGKDVKFGIHPVAGRMPGHMNVLLAEAEINYEDLYDLEVINKQFKETDVVIVIGANDVINPAANTAVNTPIYQMPILNVSEARHIIICNYDTKPGYAGVDNPLYQDNTKVSLLLGDAKESISKLIKTLQNNQSNNTLSENKAITLLKDSQKIVIVPGYGMAVSQSQHLVKRLAEVLEQDNKEVLFGIHPVAGRMPGHMNVLLAEVDVDYEKLLDIDQINPQFKDTDVVIVIGANDVINPAANTAVNTPIYQMPILNVSEARHIIICNYDTKPGYAGVDNPLYQDYEKVSLYLGDAKESLQKIIDEFLNY